MTTQRALPTRAEVSAAFDKAGIVQRDADTLEGFALPRPNDVKFIEHKPLEFDHVERLIEPARVSNHFTNFGPVTTQLENALHALWGLPEDRVVIAASSATTALFALVGVHSHRLGRPLRIAASSFGFMSSNIGPISETILVDCDDRGMLDLEALDAALLDQVDALLVTNIFGNFRSFSEYRAFCAEHGKILLLDNATGFWGVDRREPIDEIVSFHHTKPWGMGEGGIAVLDQEDAELFRILMNFGVGAADWLRAYANNAKVSDFNSAFHLERLERMPEWSRLYQAQLQRISDIARACGYRPFLDGHRDQIHAHLPLEAPRPINMDKLNGTRLPLKKYYSPLTEQTPRAVDIFDHNICVPAHLGMIHISDEEIEMALKDLL
ncbi:DegT/DnrJ/EryC1/StrS family aminotransferase [Aliiroseovarius marinus]|uniref:DegT/DnrJ/EryC1/StrS family aminotransferase n=1 Tax=Aliiroseovarius marinus TaxID=2500159 RepID=UPI003D7E132D